MILRRGGASQLAAALALIGAAAQQPLEACLQVGATPGCDVAGVPYVTWAAESWEACRAACCRDPTCAAWSHNGNGGRAVSCSLTAADGNATTAPSASGQCGVAREILPAASPSALPEHCGGVAFVHFQRTRAGTPFVRVDATSYVHCQAQCCADAKCRGWVFSPGSEPSCAMIESPGGDYAAASVISGCVGRSERARAPRPGACRAPPWQKGTLHPRPRPTTTITTLRLAAPS